MPRQTPGGLLSAEQTTLTLPQRAMYDRLLAAGVAPAIAKQLALAVAKSSAGLDDDDREIPAAVSKASNGMGIAKAALAAVRLRKATYHEAFVSAAKDLLPSDLVERIHIRARGRAGGHASGEARRQVAENNGQEMEGACEAMKSEGVVPPKGVQAACARGLELVADGKGGDGLTAGAKARARSMANGAAVSAQNISKMRAWFARHDSYSKEASPPSPGYVAWLLWGGDAGKTWAEQQSAKLEKGGPGSGPHAGSADAAKKASNKALESGNAIDHQVAAIAHRAAATAAISSSQHGSVAYHQSMAAFHDSRASALGLAKGETPLGAAFSHARASGKKKDKESVKRRAEAWLKENGHEGMKKAAPLQQELSVDALEPLSGKKKKKDDQASAKRIEASIIKAEQTPWKRLVTSVVYEPDTYDTDMDFMDAETIEKACHNFMRNGGYINVEHAGEPVNAEVVENWIAPTDITFGDAKHAHLTVSKGTWLQTVAVHDETIWQGVLDGTFGGFSLEGTALREDGQLP